MKLRILLPLLAAASVAQAQDASFLFAPKYGTGLAPYVTRIADMDGDGDKDVLTVDLQDQEVGTVTVSLNDGKGRFAQSAQVPVGAGAAWMEVGDLNGDGRPDVVVSNSGATDTSAVTVYVNNGSGGLVSPRYLTAPPDSMPQGLAIGDWNQDGKPDVAVAYQMLGAVRVYWNSGSATFPTSTTVSTGFTPRSLAAADFNNDGKLDFVVSSVDSSQVVFGTGSGFVSGPFLNNFVDGCDHLVAGDFDNDGDSDFVSTGRTVTLFTNSGSGQSWSLKHFPAGENAVGVAAADMDNDGNLDVVAAVYLGNSATVYFGDGAGGFPVRQDWGVGLAPNDLAVGDVNGDGRSDIVAPSSQLSQTEYHVVLNGGGRKFLARRDYQTVGDAEGLAAADFDRDGHQDLAVAVYQSNQDDLQVLKGRGDGTFDDPVVVEQFGNNMPTNVISGDFNKDGWPDLAASIFSPGNRLRVWLNDGAGGFAPSAWYESGGNPGSLASADLSGDGWPDIAVVNSAQTDNTLSYFWNNGDGTFSLIDKLPTLLRPSDVAIGDFDRDGDMDLLVTHYQSPGVVLFTNDGFGHFTSKTINLGVVQTTVNVADFNRDGWLDVALTTGVASVLFNDHNGGFQLVQTGFSASASVGMGDFDQDGDMDLLATDSAAGQTRVLLNNGSGTFTAGPLMPVGYLPGRCKSADLNHDGLPEPLTANTRAGSVSVLLNTTWTVAEAATVFRGVLDSGGLEETKFRDDQRMIVHNGLVLNPKESPVTFRFETTSPLFTPATLAFLLEARSSTAGLTQRIDLYEWATATWVEVDARAATTTDQAVQVQVADPARFVDLVSRKMRAQVRFKPSGPVQSFVWTGQVDFAAWKVR